MKALKGLSVLNMQWNTSSTSPSGYIEHAGNFSISVRYNEIELLPNLKSNLGEIA